MGRDIRPRLPWWAALGVAPLIVTGQHDAADQFLERASRKKDPEWWAGLDRHDQPHLNISGGCLCRCPDCVRDVKPESDYLRCVCDLCNEDCPTDRLDRPSIT